MKKRNMANGKRKPIPLTIAADIIWQADHTCCMCGKRKDIQIHHINGNRADSSPENLIPLCPNCHSDSEQKGGHGRRFTKAELRKYRDASFKRVREQRQQRELTKPDPDLTLMASFEVRKIRYEIEENRLNWKLLEDRLFDLLPYARDFGFPVKSEVAYAASLASEEARMGITEDVVRALQAVLLEVLPIGFGGLRAPSRREITEDEKELIRSVIETASGLVWDFCRYLRTVEGLEVAVYILFAALQFVHLNGLAEEEKEALDAFNLCALICGEKRDGKTFERGKEILETWRREALSENY